MFQNVVIFLNDLPFAFWHNFQLAAEFIHFSIRRFSNLHIFEFVLALINCKTRLVSQKLDLL